MELKNKQFTLNKARDIDSGDVLDREARRKGQLVTSIVCNGLDSPLVFEYASGGYVRTSRVQDISLEDGILKAYTMNTYYEFLEV